MEFSKRTIQKYLRTARPREPRGQNWSTFLKNHAEGIWACDFLQSYDILFRPLFVLVFIHHASRKIVHATTTRFPSHAWVAQQLRNATPFGEAPRFLLRDRDGKFGEAFDAVAKATGIRVIKSAPHAPNMNAICERFLGSLRRECLDHIIVCDERHLHRVVRQTPPTTTRRGLIRASARKPPCRARCRPRRTSSRSRCSAGFITSTGGRLSGAATVRDRAGSCR